MTISEDASIGYSLPRLKAHDNDTGTNADISYAVRGGDGKFVFDKASGKAYSNDILFIGLNESVGSTSLERFV